MALSTSALTISKGPVLAQDSIEEILVTGSRIQRTDLTSVGPVTVLSETDIENSGITNLETLLQRMPAAAGFGGNSTSAYWVSNGWGTPQINLRGLGINRTLVLINGRRVVFGGTGANSAVDLSMIPMSLISRVEVLKDGASATYGADAIAGVVNLITKDSFDGLEAELKLGTTDEGDGEELLLDVTWGANSDQGHLMVNMSYQDNRAAPMWIDSRAPCPESPGGNCNFLSSHTIGGNGNVPAGYTLPGGAVTPIVTRINFNQILGGDGEAFAIYDSATDGFNYNEYFNASNPMERLSFSTLGSFAVTDSVNLFAELMYTKRWSSQPASPATLKGIDFAWDHPTNPTGIDFTMRSRRLLENGARYFEQETDTFRVVTGFEGAINDNWSFDTAFNWGRNTGSDAVLNNINMGRLSETLDVLVCDIQPGIPCADLFGYGDVTQEVLDYIVFTETGIGGNAQMGLSGNVYGDVFELPAGTVGVAVGAEWREEKGWRTPDSLSVAGLALGNQDDPISGVIESKEIYGEIHIPLLANVEMAEAVDLDVAVRMSEYDRFDGDNTYKVGLNWRVNDMFKVRGTYTTAFRIPNVPDLFSGVSEGNMPTVDPCHQWDLGSATDDLYLNCQAAGVPLGYVQTSSTISTDRGGNPNLEPETATSFTVGIVAEPLDGLSITIDYFDIEIEDAIRSTPGTTKLALCYNSSGLSHEFCKAAHHTRDSLGGEVNFLSTQKANTGTEVMSGIDVGIVYKFDAQGMSHSVDLQTTYLSEYSAVDFEGDAAREIAGHIGCCSGGYPEWRALATWSTQGERWSGNYSIQMIGAADDTSAKTGAGSHMDAVFYNNAQLSYRVSDQVRISAGIDNLFQQDAPYVSSWTDANTDTMTYDLLGRRGYVRFTYRLQ